MTDTGPVWTWSPMPAGPDPVPEQATRSLTGTGCTLAAARIRGKRHRYRGEFCDDWFELGTAGPWTIIAVSDGAGSAAFARVGARVICETAVHLLREQLCAETDESTALRLVLDTAKAARDATEGAVRARKASPAHLAVTGRQPVLADFLATCLIVAHRPGLILGARVGDGDILVIDDSGQARSLGASHHGDFAGETEFLTGPHPPGPETLFLDRQPFRHLAVATDGVADDFFPAAEGGPRLFAELALNGILAPSTGSEHAVDDYARISVVHGPSGIRDIPIRHLEDLAEALGKTVHQVLASPQLLAAGQVRDSRSREDCLLDWLEGYTVRGSFDDRTVVVLSVEAT